MNPRVGAGFASPRTAAGSDGPGDRGTRLAIVLPGAIGLFRDIDSAITLAFLTRFSTQAKVDWLTPRRLKNWLRSQRYPNPRRAQLAKRLRMPTTGVEGVDSIEKADAKWCGQQRQRPPPNWWGPHYC